VEVQVEGQLVFNTIALRMNVVLAGFGLAYLPEFQVQAYLVDRWLSLGALRLTSTPAVRFSQIAVPPEV
jgi:DNA-binding transcriptional LysR family regulator